MIRKPDVNIMVTLCLHCMIQLSSALSLKREKKIKVMRVAQLLDVAYKLGKTIN